MGECGVMIPIPQYPLYTAALALNDARAVEYYLQEDQSWGVNVDEMRAAVHKARSEGTDLRALVVINPGNPTGQCLSRENMEETIRLCYDEKLILMADEVYQNNVFDKETRPVVSFKKAVLELGAPYAENTELVSFHSMSKGQIGECVRRGGFFEIVNFDKGAVEQIYKLASIQLCAGLQGQIGIDLMVNPPREGDESYEQYTKESTTSRRVFTTGARRFARLLQRWKESLATRPRVPCTSSPRSGCRRKPSRRQSRQTRPRTLFTASTSSRRREFAWSLALALAKSQVPSTSGPPS